MSYLDIFSVFLIFYLIPVAFMVTVELYVAAG